MAGVTTMPAHLWPLMEGESLVLDRCAVCGRSAPLNQHHVVRRSAGELWREGRRVEKPTITLCGFGNVLRDSYGRLYCHGAAHSGLLHLRWDREGRRWLFLRTERPTRYADALEMAGWRPLPRWGRRR